MIYFSAKFCDAKENRRNTWELENKHTLRNINHAPENTHYFLHPWKKPWRALPTMFLKIAIKCFAKHFNQLQSQKMFSLTLAGETFSATAIFQWLFNFPTNYVLPETYSSKKHKIVIHLKKNLTYTNKTLPTQIPLGHKNYIFSTMIQLKRWHINGLICGTKRI